MDYMNFGRHNDMTALAKKLNALPVEVPRVMDWPLLDSYGLYNKVSDAVTHEYESPFFRDDGLMVLYTNEEVVYKELLVEFLASFEYVEGPRDKHFNTRTSIKFRLCEKNMELSLISFAQLLGLLGPRQDLEIYKNHLDRATTKKPPTYDFIELWHAIGMNEHASHKCRSSDLKDPLYRLIHRLNASTILFHTQPEKINSQHLKGLWYILHPADRWHLPLALVTVFLQARDGKYLALPCGNLVTTLAQNANLLTDHAKFACTEIKVAKKSYSYLCNAMVLKKLPGKAKYRIYRIGERKEGGASGPNATTQNGTAGASSSNSNPQSTLSQIVHHLEKIGRQHEELKLQNYQLGKYLDDLNRMMSHASHQQMAPLWHERTGQPEEGTHHDEENDDDEDSDI